MSLNISTIVCAYLRWRYGGNCYALKPPLGYHPVYSRVSLWYKLRYRLWQYPRYQVENYLFQRYGQPMKTAFTISLTERSLCPEILYDNGKETAQVQRR